MCLVVILAAGPVLLSYLSRRETGQKHARMLWEDKEETNHIGFLVNLLLEHTAKQAITKSQFHVTVSIYLTFCGSSEGQLIKAGLRSAHWRSSAP